MIILFIENRYKTALWDALAQSLQSDGHEIHWIIQNPLFKPKTGVHHVLKFPNGGKAISRLTPSGELKKIIESNRGINYFGISSDDFIYHYDELITDKIAVIKPQLVVGECTAFHELLAIKACKEFGILFLHPTTCRYPAGRISFYLNDTLEPFGWSNEVFKKADASEFIERISNREVKPDYMKKVKKGLSKWELLKDKLRLTISYYRGEKFNTPSPFVKQRLNKAAEEAISEWEALAVDYSEVPKGFQAVYAMQMQPEANIDVWGYPHRDQTKVIQEIVNELQGDEVLILKPNPKSKYEIEARLIEVINANKGKVYCLNHSSKMEELWDSVDLFVTVTGTISMECVFANKPIAMLGIGLQTMQGNCAKMNDLSGLREVIEKVKSDSFPKLTLDEKIDFMNQLVATSYPGIIGDGLHGREYLESAENMNNLLYAFREILKQVE